MNDLPKSIQINEEGPREGFQFENAQIATQRKIDLVNALSETGLKQIQVCSFVPPKNVPGMADADDIIRGFKPTQGVRYTALWLNEKGLQRALAAGKLEVRGSIALTASETFLKRNQNRTFSENIEAQRRIIEMYKANNVPVERGSIMAAFGCNFEGDIPLERILATAQQVMDVAAEYGLKIKVFSLADTMAWATPSAIHRTVGALQNRFPDIRLALHLHDTRGMGIANAYAGLQMGIDIFDASVGGLGGCPFAAHRSAAGNVCTEDLVFMCEELGIDTGVDLEKLVEAARLAEDVVGHPLPGSVMHGGTLRSLRERARAVA
jgi:hydroxymethylglutaryl-CoA lyase